MNHDTEILVLLDKNHMLYILTPRSQVTIGGVDSSFITTYNMYKHFTYPFLQPAVDLLEDLPFITSNVY